MVGDNACAGAYLRVARSPLRQIVKERQMEFDVETDPETLYELFGDDADSLGE